MYNSTKRAIQPRTLQLWVEDPHIIIAIIIMIKKGGCAQETNTMPPGKETKVEKELGLIPPKQETENEYHHEIDGEVRLELHPRVSSPPQLTSPGPHSDG